MTVIQAGHKLTHVPLRTGRPWSVCGGRVFLHHVAQAFSCHAASQELSNTLARAEIFLDLCVEVLLLVNKGFNSSDLRLFALAFKRMILKLHCTNHCYCHSHISQK